VSVLVAAQITAIATALLSLLAMVTAAFAVLAFQKQSAEVATLQRQASRDGEDRHRAQAVQIYAWADQRPYEDDPADLRTAACLMNGSGHPIYDVRLGWGTSAQQRLPVLLPSKEYVIPGAGTSVADGSAPVWAEFRDAAGNLWRTDSTGQLVERLGRATR